MRRIALLVFFALAIAGLITPVFSQTQVSPDDITPGEWLMSKFSAGALKGRHIDPVMESLVFNTFGFPSENTESPAGVTWVKIAAKNGVLQCGKPRGIFYCVTKINVEKSTTAVMSAPGVFRVFINGKPYPGEYYNMDFARIPVSFKKGENIIVAGCFIWRGKTPALRFKTTKNEIEFNEKDLTRPDWRVGESAAQYLGVPVLNMKDEVLMDVAAEVVENDYFTATSRPIPALAPRAVTKVPFLLKPKKTFTKPDETIPVKIKISSPSLGRSYDYELNFKTVVKDKAYSKTFISKMDNSVQYYGVNPPEDFNKEKEYALGMSLHGATGEARGQSGCYQSKDWCYIVAPTNRRPMGFDWEDWGRIDAIEVLQDAIGSFNIDQRRVYLLGHSMGGHGVWHVGVAYPHLFAALAPSAGWVSFFSYGGKSALLNTGIKQAIYRSMAASNTLSYISNISKKGIYILHGGNDREVPVRESKNMYTELKKINTNVVYDEVPDMGHWWDKSPEKPGMDCLDWDPLFEYIRKYKNNPNKMNFKFITPSPWINGEYSFIRIISEIDPYKDCRIESVKKDEVIELTVENIRALSINTKLLKSAGVTKIKMGEEVFNVPEGELILNQAGLRIDEYDGKKPGIHGPFKEVFFRPFCFVYSEDDAIYKEHASYLVAVWCIKANGFSFAVPFSKLTPKIRANYNLVYLGVPVPEKSGEKPFSLSKKFIKVGDKKYRNSGIMLCYPDKKSGRLDGYIFTTDGKEKRMVIVAVPFRSGSGIPDYLIWNKNFFSGGWNASRGGGFFDADWKFKKTLFRGTSD